MHRPDHGVLRVGVGLVALLGRREEEQRVVHGYAEDHGAEEERSPGVNVPLGGEAQEAGKVAVLEDEAGYPEGAGQRQRGDENPGGGDEWRPEGDQQEQEADCRQHPEDEGGLGRQGALEVVVLSGGAAHEAAGG